VSKWINHFVVNAVKDVCFLPVLFFFVVYLYHIYKIQDEELIKDKY
jgi:hypothetical protein